MSNFYKDNPDILFHFQNMDLSRIIDLKEDNFSEKGKFPEAPVNREDALDNYLRILDITGDIAGEFIAPRAADVDVESVHFENGTVTYAKGTTEALERLKKADLLGFTLPRRFGGINMPKTVYSAAIEIIARGDAGLTNLFGLQEISATIYKYGSEDQHRRFLPRFCSGEVSGSMALTEPDAGSDLQGISLKARQGDNGQWLLNGVKRFITNGNGDVSLVMARSEEEISGGRGISLFIYERDKNMRIRRIENKLGIHGAPTCELQFNNAEAELLGKRKLGLIRYTMSLMNGARLGISAQALGIAEAAFRESDKYAEERIQFNRPIRDFSAVYEMLTDMKTSIEAGRSLLYETSRIVDIKEGLEEAVKNHPERKNELKAETSLYSKYASLFTPITKAYTTEMANKVCYDAIQIHGGVGFTTEFNVERHFRDVRITSIYEGTTQLQVVAAIGGIFSGIIFDRLDEYENNDFSSVSELYSRTQELRKHLEDSVTFVKGRNSREFQEFHAGRLVDLAADTILSYLLCLDAIHSERKKKVANLFIQKAAIRIQANMNFIKADDGTYQASYRDILKRT
ncbi:MAG: acyl-CoA dehydrogenase family protein [Candidatus Aminicenantaceae bacterium]